MLWGDGGDGPNIVAVGLTSVLLISVRALISTTVHFFAFGERSQGVDFGVGVIADVNSDGLTQRWE